MVNTLRQDKTLWLLVGIVIIASLFRLYHITSTPPGLYRDEAADGNNALENIHTGTMKVFYPEDHGRHHCALLLCLGALFSS